MNSKKGLIDACKRVLWVEKEMRDAYSIYRGMLSDPSLKAAVSGMEQDESRHVNLAEKIIAILQE